MLFQIYWAGDRDSIVARINRAKRAGAVGLIVTLDWSFVHSRDWGSPKIPSKIDFQAVREHAVETTIRPGWFLEWVRLGSPPDLTIPNVAVGDGPAPGFFDAYGTWMSTPPPTWDDIAGCASNGTGR